MVEVCSAWNRATGGSNSSHQPPTLPDMPSHSTRENGSYRAQNRGLSVGVLWNFLRTGGRRLAALAVRWLVDVRSQRVAGMGSAARGSPGMGVGPPERSRNRAAGLSRTGRAPGVLFSVAGGLCLPGPGRPRSLRRPVRRLPAPARPDDAPRRRRPGPPLPSPGPAGAPAPLRVRRGPRQSQSSWPSPRSWPCRFRPRRRRRSRKQRGARPGR